MSLFKGFLLLGPPGVGKTFAVKAVQKICKPYLNLNIEELSIPDILSDEDPLKKLQDIFRNINLRKNISIVDNSNSNNNSKTPVSKSDVSSFISPNRFDHRSVNSSSLPLKNSHSSINSIFSPIKNKDDNYNNDVINNTISRDITFIIIDEVDALGLPENHSDIQCVVKKNICNWLDQINSNSNTNGNDNNRGKCCIIATSNRTDDVDPSLRRGGRFEKEIEVIINQFINNIYCI